MRKIAAVLGVFFGVLVLVSPLLSSARTPMNLEKEVLALRAEVNDLKPLRREVDQLKNEVFHKTSPWQAGMIQHVEWDPENSQSVERMKLALGDAFYNHGGLLRLTINGRIIEAPKGTFIDFQSPRWKVVSTWPAIK